MRVRDFRPQDFAQFHPGGELGKRLLTTAQDVMISENLPIIPKEMHLGEAIIHVSKGKLGLGIALSGKKIAGLITDGDIRRAMERWQAEFFNHTVKDIIDIFNSEVIDYEKYKKYIEIRLDNSLWIEKYQYFYKALLALNDFFRLKDSLIIEDRKVLKSCS